MLGNCYHSKNKLKTDQARASLGMFLSPAVSGQQKALDLAVDKVVLRLHNRGWKAEGR